MDILWRLTWLILLAPLGAAAVVLGARASTDAAQCLLLFSGTVLLAVGVLPGQR